MRKGVVVRHSQSQGSVERCNRDIENILACWSLGLQFVMYAKNARHHSGIGRLPFMAQIEYEANLGAQTFNLLREILEGVTVEEELLDILPNSSPEDLEETITNLLKILRML